jgi:DNA-directed RNA polymerase subunit RPC12/RpoP
LNRKIGVVLQHKIVTVTKMTETLLQLVILTLPIYALLTLLIVTHTKRSLNLPHWGKTQPKNKTKRRKQHITRLGPGKFTIQEEEKRPRGKPKGAKGGGRHKPQKVDQIREAHPNHCNHCGAKIPKTRKPRKTNKRTVVDLEKTEGSLTKKITLWKAHQLRCQACGKPASGENQVNAQKGPHLRLRGPNLRPLQAPGA